MPFSERKGDLFEATDLDTLAHGVNCKGVMGAGIARQFATRYPLMKKLYVERCEEVLSPGEVFTYYHDDNGPLIYNLATQRRPGPDAKLRWVAKSVATMLADAESLSFPRRIGIPRIGSHIGGLEWVEVRMILELLANESSIELVVFSL